MILDGAFLPASESQNIPKMSRKESNAKKRLWVKKCLLRTVALAVKLCRKSLAKIKQPKVARVELRAGGCFHWSEKPGWSAGGKEK